MAIINFGGVEEEVVTREEFPLERAREVLKDEVVAVLGYGVQGPAQALNMRDNGVKVIVGQRRVEGGGYGDIDAAADHATHLHHGHAQTYPLPGSQYRAIGGRQAPSQSARHQRAADLARPPAESMRWQIETARLPTATAM